MEGLMEGLIGFNGGFNGVGEGHAYVQAHLQGPRLERVACVCVLRVAEEVVDRQPVQHPGHCQRPEEQRP
jgi:hypothetical protein